MSDSTVRKTFSDGALDGITPVAMELIRAFHSAGIAVWVVGGTLRDFLSGKDIVDIDLVVDGDPKPLADSFAKRLGLGFATLDKARGTIRLAIKEPSGLLIDINRLNGNSIEEDLRRRDFTINSIAALWTGEGFDIPDPLGGEEDLSNGLLRLSSPDSLIEDPLRVARAYRFWLVYGLEIHQELTKALKKAAPLLSSVAFERVSHELFHILEHPQSHRAFRKMAKDGVLKVVLPEVAAGDGVGQNEWHHLDVLGHTMETLERLEKIVAVPPDWLAPWMERMSKEMSAKLSYGADRLSALKLAALLHDIGKPEARSVTEDGRVTFYSHDKMGATLARKAAVRLRLSGAVADGIDILTRNHLRPFNAISDGRITERAMFRFLRDAGEWASMAILLALADAEATRGPAVTIERREAEKAAAADVLRFMDKMERDREKTAPLLNGRDIMARFGLAPGPLIGMLLDKLEEAAALEEIKDREDAFEFVGGLLKYKDRQTEE